MKGELKGKIFIKFIGLRAKSCKKAEGTKKWGIKKLSLKTITKCLEATHLKNKIKHLEKNKYDIYSHKKIIKNS